MGRRRPASAKKWRAKVARVAKTVALKNLETKHITVDVSSTPIYKDAGATSGSATPLSIYPLRLLTQGTGDGDTIGDEVTLKGINMHFNFRNASANQTVSFVRIMAGWLNPNVTNIGNNWRIGNTPDAVSAFIRNPNDIDAIWKKVLVDRVYGVKSILTGVDNMRLMKIHVPMHNKRYTRSLLTPFAGIHEDFVILVVGSSSTGTVLTTQVGTFDGFVRVWYKDG